MEKLSLTPGGEAQVPILAAILTHGSQHKLKHGDTVWDDAWSEEEVRDYLETSTPYIVTLDNQEVGAVWLQWDDEELWGPQPPNAGYMHRLVIKDDFHGAGLGAAVIEEVAKLVQQNGRSLLRLDCPSDNEKLCQYYENLGFNKVADKVVPEYGYAEALYERNLE